MIRVDDFAKTTTHGFSQDETGEAQVIIKKMTQAGYYALAEESKKTTLKFDNVQDGRYAQEQDFNIEHFRTMECYVTFEEATGITDNGNPLFRRGMSKEDFFMAFGRLPKSVTREWMNAVREFNPELRPNG